MSTSFGAKKLKIHAGGRYAVRLAANAIAKRALSSGKTLHVRETITFTPATGGKPVVRTFTVTVHGSKTHKKH